MNPPSSDCTPAVACRDERHGSSSSRRKRQEWGTQDAAISLARRILTTRKETQYETSPLPSRDARSGRRGGGGRVPKRLETDPDDKTEFFLSSMLIEKGGESEGVGEGWRHWRAVDAKRGPFYIPLPALMKLVRCGIKHFHCACSLSLSLSPLSPLDFLREIRLQRRRARFGVHCRRRRGRRTAVEKGEPNADGTKDKNDEGWEGRGRCVCVRRGFQVLSSS